MDWIVGFVLPFSPMAWQGERGRTKVNNSGSRFGKIPSGPFTGNCMSSNGEGFAVATINNNLMSIEYIRYISWMGRYSSGFHK